MSAGQKTAFIWTSTGNNGTGGALLNNSTAWGYSMPYPVGSQAFSLQENSTLSQSIYFPSAGSYTINWSQASRSGQNNPYWFQLNGSNVGSEYSTTNTAWTPASDTFTVGSAGNYTIGFLGTATSDNSVGLANISITGGPNGTAQLPALTAVQMTTSGGVWDLNGGSQIIGSLAGVAGSTVLDNGPSSTLTTGGDNTNTQFAGAITGSGGLAKIGAGTLTLSGMSTLGGQVNVNSGGLQVNGALTASVMNIINAAQLSGSGTIQTLHDSLYYNTSAASTFAGAIAGNQQLEVDQGSLTLTGTGSSYSGGTSLSGGTLAVARTTPCRRPRSCTSVPPAATARSTWPATIKRSAAWSLLQPDCHEPGDRQQQHRQKCDADVE